MIILSDRRTQSTTPLFVKISDFESISRHSCRRSTVIRLDQSSRSSGPLTRQLGEATSDLQVDGAEHVLAAVASRSGCPATPALANYAAQLEPPFSRHRHRRQRESPTIDSQSHFHKLSWLCHNLRPRTATSTTRSRPAIVHQLATSTCLCSCIPCCCDRCVALPIFSIERPR